MTELQDELARTGRHSGEVAERTRLSRDIHDTIAQSLSSIRLISHAAANRETNPDTQQTFSQIETLSSESLTDVRRIISALAPSELEDNALVAALERLLHRLQEVSTMRPRSTLTIPSHVTNRDRGRAASHRPIRAREYQDPLAGNKSCLKPYRRPRRRTPRTLSTMALVSTSQPGRILK